MQSNLDIQHIIRSVPDSFDYVQKDTVQKDIVQNIITQSQSTIKNVVQKDIVQKDVVQSSKSPEQLAVEEFEYLLNEIGNDWTTILKGLIGTKTMLAVMNEYAKAEREYYQILPPKKNIFNAFFWCSPQKVSVVIIGQDPYPTPGHANGLSFSVNKGVTIPASLRNIFKNLEQDPNVIFTSSPTHGDLTSWCKQGVLLLNSELTTIERRPDSHQGLWNQITNFVVEHVSEYNKGVVFMLWGNKAQAKENYIRKRDTHLILKSHHPSPQVQNSNFIKNGHFSSANEFLVQNGQYAIDWSSILKDK
jgi:uracil-DNA glycosylase